MEIESKGTRIKNFGVSVVLASYNRLSFLKATIESIRLELKDCDFESEIIVIDGGSTDGSVKWLTEQRDIITIIQHNRGLWDGKPIPKRSWGYFINLGFKAAQGKYVCMLSDDCLVIPGAIKNGQKRFEDLLHNKSNTGALAFYWRNWPEQQDYWVGLTMGEKVFVNHGMYLNSALIAVGYAEEELYNFYHADGDLCLKMWDQGYTCEISDNSYVEHFSHANMQIREGNLSKQKQDWETYQNRWSKKFSLDNSKDWVTKNYIDPTATYKMFSKPMRTQKINKFLPKFLNNKI